MPDRKSLKPFVPSLVTALLTFAVYSPALGNGFVNWDDQKYVYKNLALRALDLKGLITSVVVGNWHPLTMLSLALDFSLWGLNPFGYHLTNNILHALNTALVFTITLKLIENARGFSLARSGVLAAATVAALLFGLHPVHVESVAWVSERKDVLSAFFFLLSILFYLKYTAAGSSGRAFNFGLAFFLFVLALLSKPMAVTLPAVLLIMDLYPLERLGPGKLRPLLIEKIPFFFMSGLWSAITVLAQWQGGTIKSMEVFSAAERILISVRAFAFYIYKLIFPISLSPYYPRLAKSGPLGAEFIGSLFFLVAVTVFCALMIKRKKIYAAVWSYYLVTLLPVSGIVQVGLQSAADRYVYLPGIGFFMLAGIGAAELYERAGSRGRRLALSLAVLIVAGLYGAKTVAQESVWKDPLALWSHVIEIYPRRSAVAYNNRGLAYEERGDYDRALEDFSVSIEIDPRYVLPYNNRAVIYLRRGDAERALGDLNMALALDADNREALVNRALAHEKIGNYEKALRDYNAALTLDPGYLTAYIYRGILFGRTGRPDLAIEDFTRATELAPAAPDPYRYRGTAFLTEGKYLKAVEDLTRALEIDPDDAVTYYNLGLAYLKLGKTGLAIKNLRTASRLGLKEANTMLDGVQ